MDSFLSSLRCEARSQPWPTGVCGSMAPWNTTSLRPPPNTRSTTNRSASLVDDETKSFRRSGDRGLLRGRFGQKGDGVAQSFEFALRPLRRLFGPALARECAACGVEIELRPLRALERPLVLGALFEFVDVAHLQQHARLPVEAVVLAVQEM